MPTWFTTFLLLLLALADVISCRGQEDLRMVQMARAEVLNAMDWARSSSLRLHRLNKKSSDNYVGVSLALGDCVELYEEAEPRLARLVSGDGHSLEDAVTWLSSGLACHRSCLDGLEEKGFLFQSQLAQNLTLLLGEALAMYGSRPILRQQLNGGQKRPSSFPSQTGGGLLASWNAATSKADLVVAQDGSGTHRTINEAVAAIAKMGARRRQRLIVYVKSGVYPERVKIDRKMKNLMFVGDGMDKTIVTGNDNVVDGATTLRSATFGVFGDGFWARDMTFENTAGPQKHQAVALSASSDLAVLYRCSFKGYQDTLFAHSLRQFYRDCHIHGTIDFIFGDASAVFQNCDIFVRRPLDHQGNMITAQGRDNPYESTGFSILNSRVMPSPEFQPVKARFRTFLGRPWGRFSRTVVMKTDLDGLVNPRGWTEWSGDFALSTLYYGEYMNAGAGASTAGRVRWPGFHVLRDPREAGPFAVRNFIQGESWIPASGVPFWLDI